MIKLIISIHHLKYKKYSNKNKFIKYTQEKINLSKRNLLKLKIFSEMSAATSINILNTTQDAVILYINMF
jgi:hypothetical protein